MKTMKQIIVNVEGLSAEEKKRMIEALVQIKNIKKCNPPHLDNVAALYGPSFDGINVGFNYHKESKPTHTPQQVLEMAGMTKKRNVRKDFDPTKEYSVDVSGCTEEEKKEVQQAFFDIGFPWVGGSKEYSNLEAKQYTNTLNTIGGGKVIAAYFVFGTDVEGCNMSAEEFINFVYEPENQGHVHAELMAQYAEDAREHEEPWKLWQMTTRHVGWVDCENSPTWLPALEYRRKIKTHIVNGVEIPDLRIRKGTKPSKTVVCVDPLDENLHVILSWTDGMYLKRYETLLDLGLLYEHTLEGQKAAVMHATAMLGI